MTMNIKKVRRWKERVLDFQDTIPAISWKYQGNYEKSSGLPIIQRRLETGTT
jgi:hypothetical protein